MSRVAVLVTQSKDDLTAHVLGPGGFHAGPLSTLKALAQKARAKGPALLICTSELQTITVPEDVAPAQLQSFLDAQCHGQALANPAQQPPSLLAVCDSGFITQVLQAARPAGLRFTSVIPIEAATLAAAPTDLRSVVIVQVLANNYLSSVISPVSLRTQGSPLRQTPQQIVETALKTPHTSGDFPTVLLVHYAAAPHDPVEIQGTEILNFGVHDLLNAALTLEPGPIEAGVPLTIVRGMRRSLQSSGSLSPALLGTIALAALVNGGLMVGANIVAGQNARLEDQKMALQLQADQVRALRAANDQLQTRVTQARQLTSDKGPLATELPLISDRLITTDTSFTTLTGPNAGSATDALAFGGTVGNIYTVAGLSKTPQNLAAAFQKGGLRADVQRISCEKTPCDVGLRIGIAPAATPSTPTTTSGVTP